jgi:hypothetical protein
MQQLQVDPIRRKKLQVNSSESQGSFINKPVQLQMQKKLPFFFIGQVKAQTECWHIDR